MTLSTGARLGPYQILAPLGAGGMGEVYKARDTRLGREVALKFLAARLTQDRTAVDRFTREARAASALNHPNIVTIYEIGEAETGQFIAMELVQGRSLRQLVHERVPVETLIQLGTQIAKALTVAHAAGIVHRDIKPENLMVRDDGYLKVLDFGLARLLPLQEGQSAAETAATQSGCLLGTVPYMAPEQARGDPVTPATDVFALGLVFYELATGRHPFEADSSLATLHAIVAQPPLPPLRLNPELPAPLDSLLRQMLEKDPRPRPTAAEVERGLAELTGTSIRAARPAGAVPTARHTVGREAERAALRAAFEETLAGRGLLLCVTGEPGIGKTTLVENFLAELPVPAIVAHGRCSERLAGSEAYLPFLEALDSLLDSDHREVVARTLRLTAPTWFSQLVPAAAADLSATAASQERVKRELGAFFHEMARLQPLVVFFDDLHWADLSTIDLLAYLGTKFDAIRMLVVSTYRAEELLLAKHPFLAVKLDLQGRGLCRELPLGFLSRADVERYLALEFPGHAFPRELAELVCAKTEGSPLFMVDVVRDLRRRGVIVQADGYWTLVQPTPNLERELPESVRSMIQRKLDQLGEVDRQLLVAASVQGEEFDAAVVARALGLDPADAEEQLEELERVHAFVRRVREQEFPDGTLTLRYRFVHVLYQNALYGPLTPARKASLSAAVAQALEGYYGDRRTEVAAELALLFEAARNFTRAADCFHLAAEHAAAVFAHHEVVALARRGLDALKALPDRPDRAAKELALLLTLGASLIAARGFGASEVGATYVRARELCRQVGEAPHLLEVLVALQCFHQTRGELAKAKAVATELLRWAHLQPVPVGGAHCLMGLILLALGEFASAREHLDRAREGQLPELLIGHDTRVCIEAFRAHVLWFLGHPDQALAASSRALARAEELSHPASRAAALWWAGFCFRQLRREWARSQALAEEEIELSREHGFALWIAWAGVWRGKAFAEQGRPEEGIAQMQEGLAQVRAFEDRAHYPRMLALLAEALGKAGRLKQALGAVSEALGAVRRTAERYYEAELHRVKGELLLMQAASLEPEGTRRRAATRKARPRSEVPPTWRQAEACFRRAIEVARRQQAKSWELRATTSLSRLCQKQGRKPEARQMLSEIYGWFTEGFDTADLQEAKALLDELA